MYVYLQGAPSTYDILSVNPNFYSYETLHNKENFVLLSGGIDSQALVLFLRKNKINCTTVFADFEFNYYDRIFAEKIGIDIRLKLDLDILYLEQEIHKYYFDYCTCTSPQLAVHLYIVDQIINNHISTDFNILLPGTPLFEYTDIDAKDILKCDKAKIVSSDTRPTYTELSYWRFKQKKKLKNFFPSFFTDFEIHNQIQDSVSIHKTFNYYTKKALLYSSLDLPIIQQDGSWTGFERYKIHLKNNIGIPYDQKVRNPIHLNKKVVYANKW